MRPLAASAPTFLVCAALRTTSAMIHAAFLLAHRQRFFLLGSDQAFHFLASLLANFTRLLLLLLGSERRVGADRFDLRTRIALRRPTLLHG